MTLKDWIEKEGPKNIAKRMRVEPSTICFWKYARTMPSAKNLLTLHRLTKKQVPIEKMLEHFARGEGRRDRVRRSN